MIHNSFCQILSGHEKDMRKRKYNCVTDVHSSVKNMMHVRTKNHPSETFSLRFVSSIDNLNNMPSLIFRSSAIKCLLSLSILVVKQANNRRKGVLLLGETNRARKQPSSKKQSFSSPLHSYFFRFISIRQKHYPSET